jgi:hypothetical protein
VAAFGIAGHDNHHRSSGVAPSTNPIINVSQYFFVKMAERKITATSAPRSLR